MAASGASSSFEWHGGGVELGAAEETRAHGGGAGMRPPGMWSFGVEGINTTADAGTSASGGVGSFGWNDGGVGLGADDEQRHEWRHLRVGAERPHGLQQQRHGVIGTLFLSVHGSVMGVVGVMVDVSTVQSSATSGAVFMSACGRVAYKNSGVGSASP